MVIAIETSSLSVDLGARRVVDGVDLFVAKGEWLAVVGPNGAGKTTLLRAIAGLVRSHGEIRIDGRPAAELDRRTRARLVALVPQDPVVPPGMTIGDYVLLGRTPHLGPFAAEGASDMDAARWALAELDLAELAPRQLDQVSGGERQRAFLARALAQSSPILLLDEPTTSLDIGHQQEVLELVDRLRRSCGLTVLVTMHDLTVAAEYAKRLVLMDRGRVVTSGLPHDVLTEEHIAQFYGAHVEVIVRPDGPVVVPRRPSRVRDSSLHPPIEEVFP
jgi:iron complex transport system ATP-binding protein